MLAIEGAGEHAGRGLCLPGLEVFAQPAPVAGMLLLHLVSAASDSCPVARSSHDSPSGSLVVTAFRETPSCERLALAPSNLVFQQVPEGRFLESSGMASQWAIAVPALQGLDLSLGAGAVAQPWGVPCVRQSRLHCSEQFLVVNSPC